MTGTILGVVIGWGLATVAEVVRWRLQSKTKDAEHKATVRRAARLILEELFVSKDATLVKRGDPFAFQFGGSRTLPTSVWNANREVLAVAPEAEGAWVKIATAFARIDELNWAFEAGRQYTVEEREALLEAIPEIHRVIEEAEEALRGLIAS